MTSLYRLYPGMDPGTLQTFEQLSAAVGACCAQLEPAQGKLLADKLDNLRGVCERGGSRSSKN